MTPSQDAENSWNDLVRHFFDSGRLYQHDVDLLTRKKDDAVAEAVKERDAEIERLKGAYQDLANTNYRLAEIRDAGHKKAVAEAVAASWAPTCTKTGKKAVAGVCPEHGGDGCLMASAIVEAVKERAEEIARLRLMVNGAEDNGCRIVVDTDGSIWVRNVLAEEARRAERQLILDKWQSVGPYTFGTWLENVVNRPPASAPHIHASDGDCDCHYTRPASAPNTSKMDDADYGIHMGLVPPSAPEGEKTK